jgi:hypothetical protein
MRACEQREAHVTPADFNLTIPACAPRGSISARRKTASAVCATLQDRLLGSRWRLRATLRFGLTPSIPPDHKQMFRLGASFAPVGHDSRSARGWCRRRPGKVQVAFVAFGGAIHYRWLSRPEHRPVYGFVQERNALPRAHRHRPILKSKTFSGKGVFDFSRGRDDDFPPPPAQIRTSSITAYGSYLGCMASKRTFGCGCRILALGIHRPTNDRNRSQVIRSRWLRRRRARYQRQIT